MKSKIIFIFVITLILGIIGISGCINDSNPTNNQTTGHYENEFVKFDLPPEVSANGNSNDTSFDIILFKNGMDIGEINSIVDPPQALSAIDGANITFADKKAIEYNDDFGSLLYIKIREDKQGNTVAIRIELDPGYSGDYEVIKNSFVVKKTP